jgi:ABC-type Fe3+-hydroxamate transport system substrate-binding protein
VIHRAGGSRDASGAVVALAGPPRRLVSLVPSITETLCALGLADALVGVSAYCCEPRPALRGKPRVGGQKDPDLDRIAALAPDLVVANLEENRREDVETLRERGTPVWVTYPRTVAEGIAMIRELGAVTATEARAAELAAPLEALHARVCAATARRRAVRVFYPIWRQPWMTVSADTYIHDMLRVCGGFNVFGDAAPRYPTTSLDEMAARRPDVILLPDEPYRFRRAHLAELACYRDVPAVAAGRLHLVDGKPFCWYGPRIGEALRTIPGLLAGPAT